MLSCFCAAVLMSSFICTRHGSPRLHWLMPMTKGSCGGAANSWSHTLLQTTPMRRVESRAQRCARMACRSPFSADAGRLEPRSWRTALPLEQDGADDDHSGQHQAGLDCECVDAENLLE